MFLFQSFFIIVAKWVLYMYHMNLITAFFYSFLNENIFVNQQEIFVINATLVCHLWKALYCLKQALFVWYTLISKFLQSLGFTKTNTDHSIFVLNNNRIFISVYVDDLVIIGKDLNIINDFKSKLLEHFCMTDLGLVSICLGMSVTQIGDFVRLDQKIY